MGQHPPASYGVHAPPVAELLREFGLQAEARSGMTWDELRAEIAAGRPVIAWVIGQIWSGTPQKYRALRWQQGDRGALRALGHRYWLRAGKGAPGGRLHRADPDPLQEELSGLLGHAGKYGCHWERQGAGCRHAHAGAHCAGAAAHLALDLPVHIFLPSVYGGSIKKQPAAQSAPLPDRYMVPARRLPDCRGAALWPGLAPPGGAERVEPRRT